MTRKRTVRRALVIHEHRHESTGRVIRHAHFAHPGTPHHGYSAARDSDRTAPRPTGPQLEELVRVDTSPKGRTLWTR